MATSDVTFERPPVVETVLSAQFQPLLGFTGAHAGRFWAELDGDWPRAEQGVAIADRFELFPEELTTERVRLVSAGQGQSEKYLLIRVDDQRVIQLQQSRFIYNWRKRSGPYPSYRTVRPEFDAAFSRFQEYVARTDLGQIELNQWEVTYFNHIPRGELWDHPRDWEKIIPALVVPSATLAPNLDSRSAAWRFELPEKKGRLHVSIKHAQSLEQKPPQQLLQLELTARGPVHQENRESFSKGLSLGHSEIVRFFDEMTSPSAQRHWGKKTGV